MAKQSRTKSSGVIINQEAPIKISIELDIVVRVRQETQLATNANLLLTGSALGGSECPDDKFSYFFDTNNANVLSLRVQGFKKDNPGDSGDFTTCIPDANKFLVLALGQERNGGGRVALTLKYLGKDVFSSPQELHLGEHGFLVLNTLAKLPL